MSVQVFCAHGQKSYSLRTALIAPSWKFRSEIAPHFAPLAHQGAGRGIMSTNNIALLARQASVQPSNTLLVDKIPCGARAVRNAVRSDRPRGRSNQGKTSQMVLSGFFHFAPLAHRISHRVFRRGEPEEYCESQFSSPPLRGPIPSYPRGRTATCDA